MSQKDTGLPGGPTEQATIGTLVGRLSEQISRLVRAEIASAKTELTTKAKGIGIGAGLIAAGQPATTGDARGAPGRRKNAADDVCGVLGVLVAPTGVDPVTFRFSVERSTN